jgi:iron complex transport system substrate-binding protein
MPTFATRTPGLFRAAALAAAAMLSTGLIAACSTAEDAPATAPSNAAAAAFPVTIAHKYGSTVIPKAPTRVVTLGLSDHEPALALGVKPVGVVDWFQERPFGTWVWQAPAWGGTAPAIVGERDEYQFEKVAALKPDLIIAQYSGMKKEQYDTLSKLAPVVAQSPAHDDYAAPWQEQTTRIGQALGVPDKAKALIADVETKFAAVRTAHPEFATQTAVVAESYEPGKYSAFSPTDPKTVFLKELGFKSSDAIGALAGTNSFTDFGSERLDLVDTDRLLWVIDDATAEKRIKTDQAQGRRERQGPVRALPGAAGRCRAVLQHGAEHPVRHRFPGPPPHQVNRHTDSTKGARVRCGRTLVGHP